MNIDEPAIEFQDLTDLENVSLIVCRTSDGPRRDALLSRFLRLAEPILKEREQLNQSLPTSCDLITTKREQMHCPLIYGIAEPEDPVYQKGVNRWLSWLHRYEAIEATLTRCSEQGVLRSSHQPR